MSANSSITLGEHYNRYVREKVGSGQYASVSEVVRAGLRLLEEREAQLNHLRQALQDGIDSGFVDFDPDEFLARKKQEQGGR